METIVYYGIAACWLPFIIATIISARQPFNP